MMTKTEARKLAKAKFPELKIVSVTDINEDEKSITFKHNFNGSTFETIKFFYDEKVEEVVDTTPEIDYYYDNDEILPKSTKRLILTVFAVSIITLIVLGSILI